MIKVKSNLKGNQLALWERHPDHPNGEIFISAGVTVTVAETPAVKAALKEGRLIEVQAPAKRSRKRK